MREILFRGKEYKGDWYEGFLFQIQLEGAAWCIGLEPLGANDYSEIYTSHYAEVIPETIGQYTGVTDKNGTKIFEGDICEFRSFNCRRVGAVIFNEEKYRFELLQSGDSGWSLPIYEVFDLEVIGNIHDKEKI